MPTTTTVMASTPTMMLPKAGPAVEKQNISSESILIGFICHPGKWRPEKNRTADEHVYFIEPQTELCANWEAHLSHFPLLNLTTNHLYARFYLSHWALIY